MAESRLSILVEAKADGLRAGMAQAKREVAGLKEAAQEASQASQKAARTAANENKKLEQSHNDVGRAAARAGRDGASAASLIGKAFGNLIAIPIVAVFTAAAAAALDYVKAARESTSRTINIADAFTAMKSVVASQLSGIGTSIAKVFGEKDFTGLVLAGVRNIAAGFAYLAQYVRNVFIGVSATIKGAYEAATSFGKVSFSDARDKAIKDYGGYSDTKSFSELKAQYDNELRTAADKRVQENTAKARASAASEAARAAEAEAKANQRLLDTLDPAAAATRQYEADLKRLTALKLEDGKAEEYRTRLLEDYIDKLRSSGDLGRYVLF